MHANENKNKANHFLKDIDTIIFDMDGVITSEENYWNAAALTVYETFTSKLYYGQSQLKIDPSAEEIKKIRKKVFYKDKIISLIKNKGINTNWDLAFIIICIVLILNKVKETDFKNFKTTEKQLELNFYKVYKYIKKLDLKGFQIIEHVGETLSKLTGKDKLYYNRDSKFWLQYQHMFQEWYLGGNQYKLIYGVPAKQEGKPGLIHYEEPLIPLEQIRQVLKTLKQAKIRLGVATGRPYAEIEPQLKKWDLKKYFDINSVITYDDVVKAKKDMHNNPSHHNNADINIAKPHPYIFLKAIYGKAYKDMELIKGNYNKDTIKSVAIVGDSGADIIPAKKINCMFIAVLTGLSGMKSKKYFKQTGADIILKDIRELIIH